MHELRNIGNVFELKVITFNICCDAVKSAWVASRYSAGMLCSRLRVRSRPRSMAFECVYMRLAHVTIIVSIISNFNYCYILPNSMDFTNFLKFFSLQGHIADGIIFEPVKVRSCEAMTCHNRRKFGSDRFNYVCKKYTKQKKILTYRRGSGDFCNAASYYRFYDA
ncbi:hypothetical protein ANN_26937 [Periplaneta americana]|uniref:Uncharacterized protein n=1 Tax=Periplaneta americana TaxID=6978 RepID=A0ABQ8RWT0_PERAM|nr:hypothetical protein ANN_26937 [Periplaneta americana]